MKLLSFLLVQLNGMGITFQIGTDAAIAAEVARWTAEKSGAVVFPTVPFGIIETTAFPGIFLSGHIYQELIREVTLYYRIIWVL